MHTFSFAYYEKSSEGMSLHTGVCADTVKQGDICLMNRFNKGKSGITAVYLWTKLSTESVFLDIFF